MKTLLADYVRGVSAYVSTGTEQALVEIEDLGRMAVDEGRPFEDIADLHESALLALAERGVAFDHAEVIRRASACLAALMMSSAVAYRARIDLVEYHRARAYAERARQRLESLGHLIGGMAHEINNLMQPIAGLTELALLDLPADAPERENLEIIARCAARSSRVLRNVLAYGRFAAPETKSTAFGPAVRRGIEFVSSVSLLWPTIVTDFADETSCATIVEDELTQILLNLIQNASQAKAKRIDVSVARTVWCFPADASKPETSRPALRLAVADNGCGMDVETLSRASEPFFSNKPPGEGTGMGLAVVGGIANSWSGQLSLDSQSGVGTTVSIYLPIDDVDELGAMPESG